MLGGYDVAKYAQAGLTEKDIVSKNRCQMKKEVPETTHKKE